MKRKMTIYEIGAPYLIKAHHGTSVSGFTQGSFSQSLKGLIKRKEESKVCFESFAASAVLCAPLRETT
jgi:hypothetical protein